MSFHLPKIYPITDTTISGLSHAEQVKRLLDSGARLIQLREKIAAPRHFLDDAIAALKYAHTADAKLIINDRVDIALAIGADGVHLGQTDMPVEAARILLGANAIIGFSTHNFEQAQAALQLPIDYLAFGPIFATSSKQNPDPVAGLGDLRRVRSIAGEMPIVAIGGINQSNISAVLAAGANAVAVISAVLSGPDEIAQNWRNLSALAEVDKRQ